MAVTLPPVDRLAARIPAENRSWSDRCRLAELMRRLVGLGPAPAELAAILPRFEELHAELAAGLLGDCGPDDLEEAFLELYAHLHLSEAPYSPQERALVDVAGGYWCHAGGIDPVVRADPYLRPDSVSVDLGAGNGLQGLLLQLVSPHRRTVQVEICREMVAIGQKLQHWLGVAGSRVEWVVADLLTVPLAGFDFVYLYRPLRPVGPGADFYRRLADTLAAHPREVTVFSVADCLGPFLDRAFELEFTTGHLTCFHRPRSTP